MKKTYTKRQITEAITYWEKILTESYATPRFSDTFQTPRHPSDFKYSMATIDNKYDTELRQFLHSSNNGFLSQHMSRFLYLAGLGKFYGKEFTPIEDMIKQACIEYTNYAMQEDDCLPFDKTDYYKNLINKLLSFLTKKISMLKANGDRYYVFKNPQEAAEKAVNDVIIPVIAVYLEH